jgi:hypothetical protein
VSENIYEPEELAEHWCAVHNFPRPCPMCSIVEDDANRIMQRVAAQTAWVDMKPLEGRIAISEFVRMLSPDPFEGSMWVEGNEYHDGHYRETDAHLRERILAAKHRGGQ